MERRGERGYARKKCKGRADERQSWMEQTKQGTVAHNKNDKLQKTKKKKQVNFMYHPSQFDQKQHNAIKLFSVQTLPLLQH